MDDSLLILLNICINIILVIVVSISVGRSSKEFFELNQPIMDLNVEISQIHEECVFIFTNSGNIVAEKLEITCKNNLDENSYEISKEWNYLLPHHTFKIYFNNIKPFEKIPEEKFEQYIFVDAEIKIKYRSKKQKKLFCYSVFLSGLTGISEINHQIELINFK